MLALQWQCGWTVRCAAVLGIGGWLAADRKWRLLGRYYVQWAEQGKGIGLAFAASEINHRETVIIVNCV